MLEFTATLFAGFIAVAAIFGLVTWCERANTGDKAAVMGLYLLWGMPGILLLIAGLALTVNGRSEGIPAMSIGLGLSLPMFKPFRKLLSKVTPIDPDSAMDWSGLTIVLAILGFVIPTAFLDNQTVEISANNASQLVNGLLQGLIAYLLISYIAVGYRNYRTGEESTARLGIQKPTSSQITYGLIGVIVAFGGAYLGGVLTDWLQPDKVEALNNSMEALTSGVTTPIVAIILALATGVGEEIFFRGALQPRLGIGLTSILFVFLHAQYGFTWILLGLFIVSLTFGWLAKNHGTMAAIVAHVIYNLLAVIINVWVL